MEFGRKVILSHCIIHLYMFISGLEYAVIFPTLWEYLQTLGVPSSQPYWLGLSISALTVTDIVTGLIAGRIVDISNKVKFLVLILNCFQLLGSILYTISPSPTCLLGSRLISGCGKSIAVVFLADICKSTSKEKRTPILLLFNIAGQLGLLLGPACNIFLRQVEFEVGWLSVNKLNAPGVFLFFLWLIFSMAVFLFYYDLVTIHKEETLARELRGAYLGRNPSLAYFENTVNNGEIMYTAVDGAYNNNNHIPVRESGTAVRRYNSLDLDVQLRVGTEFGSDEALARRASTQLSIVGRSRRYDARRDSKKSNVFIDAAENLMGEGSSRDSSGSRVSDSREDRLEFDENYFESPDVSSRRSFSEYIRDESLDVSQVTSVSDSSPPDDKVTMNEYIDALVRDEVVALVLTRFTALLCQTSLETVVPPVMQLYFDYGDMANSILYLCAGLELIVVFLVLTLASRCISDRILVVAGLFLMVVALSWLTATLPNFQFHDRSNIPYFAVGVGLDLAGIPMVCDIGIALYSKILPDRVQGLGHGLRRFFSQLAFILGPLWGSSTLSRPALMLAVPLGLVVLSLFLFLASYKRLKPTTEERDNHENFEVLGRNETTPLLT